MNTEKEKELINAIAHLVIDAITNSLTERPNGVSADNANAVKTLLGCLLDVRKLQD